MVSLLSLSSSLQGNSSVCTCVCAQCFGIFCWFDYFKFSILLCACYPAFITKGYMALSSLISALAMCVFLSGACIPCPASLLQHILWLFFHTPKGHTASGCTAQKGPSQRRRVEGWKKGPITYAGHDITAADRFHIW